MNRDLVVTMTRSCGVDATGRLAYLEKIDGREDEYSFQFLEGEDKNMPFSCCSDDFKDFENMSMNRNGANKS